MEQRVRHNFRLERGYKPLSICLPLAASLAASLVAVGCSEPVDCGSEPARCLPPAYGLAIPASLLQQQGLARGTDGARADAPQRLQAPASIAGPNNGAEFAKRRMRVLPPTDSMAARTREGVLAQIQDDKAAAVVGPELKLRAIRKALASAVPALKNHDFAALKAIASQRFAGNIGEIETKYAERFWRHADKYVPVLSGAPPAIALQDQEGGKVQATLTGADGSELRCILVEEGGTWKIDRF